MPDLTSTLDTFLRTNFGKPYVPGQHDCVLFIAEWADLISGSAHAESIRGTYETHFAGLRIHVKSHGSISFAVKDRLLKAGWSLVTPGDPYETGDVILTDGDHPGIWRGKSIVATAFGFGGHAYIHRRHATGALRWIKQ